MTIRWSPRARAQLDATRFTGPREVEPARREVCEAIRTSQRQVLDAMERAAAVGFRLVPRNSAVEQVGDTYRMTTEWEPVPIDEGVPPWP